MASELFLNHLSKGRTCMNLLEKRTWHLLPVVVAHIPHTDPDSTGLESCAKVCCFAHPGRARWRNDSRDTDVTLTWLCLRVSVTLNPVYHVYLFIIFHVFSRKNKCHNMEAIAIQPHRLSSSEHAPQKLATTFRAAVFPFGISSKPSDQWDKGSRLFVNIYIYI